MYEQTIDEILSKDVNTKNIFKKALARDELLDKPEYPSFYVNTQPGKPGERWLAIHFDESVFIIILAVFPENFLRLIFLYYLKI